MLFLGLGTGLGSTMIVDGIVEPMELGHLPYKKGTYEDYVGKAGLERHGKKKWRRDVADVVARFFAALEPDDIVIGGGNVKKLDALPPHSRAGDNAQCLPRRVSTVAGRTLLSRAPGGVRNHRLEPGTCTDVCTFEDTADAVDWQAGGVARARRSPAGDEGPPLADTLRRRSSAL